jgi:hypothetical protein
MMNPADIYNPEGNVRMAMKLLKRSRTCITQHWINAGLLPETPRQKKQHSNAKGT